jgi:hypothetical protein
MILHMLNKHGQQFKDVYMSKTKFEIDENDERMFYLRRL